MFQKYDIPLSKEYLLGLYEKYKSSSFSLKEYHNKSYSHENTRMIHAPVKEFDLDLGVEIKSARFCIYDQSSLFIHKDRKVRSRLGLILQGEGPVLFYDEDKKYIQETDFQTWTLIDTDVWHSVPESSHRISFQFGFGENYEQMLDKIKFPVIG